MCLTTCRAGRSRGRGCFNPAPERRRLRRGSTGSSILFGWALSCWSSQEVVRVSRSCSVGIRRNIGASCKKLDPSRRSPSLLLGHLQRGGARRERIDASTADARNPRREDVDSQSWQFQRLPAQLSPTAHTFLTRWGTVALYLVTFQCVRAPAFTNYPLARAQELAEAARLPNAMVNNSLWNSLLAWSVFPLGSVLVSARVECSTLQTSTSPLTNGVVIRKSHVTTPCYLQVCTMSPSFTFTTKSPLNAGIEEFVSMCTRRHADSRFLTSRQRSSLTSVTSLSVCGYSVSGSHSWFISITISGRDSLSDVRVVKQSSSWMCSSIEQV